MGRSEGQRQAERCPSGCRDTQAHPDFCTDPWHDQAEAHELENRRDSGASKEGLDVEPKVIDISECVRVVQTSSDGEWLDGFSVEWCRSPGEDWCAVELPPRMSEQEATAIAATIADFLQAKVSG